MLHIVSSDAYAGLERHAVGLIGELRKLGCAAELACPPTGLRMRAEATDRSIPVRPPAHVRAGTWLLHVTRTIVTAPPHIIHVHDGRAAPVGALLAAMTGTTLVRTQHFTQPASEIRPGWRGRMSRALHRSVNRRVAGYVAVSRAAADAARGRHELGTALVAVIPPGIDLPADEVVADSRSWREGAGTLVVVSMGRLEPERRIDVLLAAIPMVRAEVPDCRFVIAGAGSAEQELRLSARRLGVEDAIEWKGWVDQPMRVLAEAHVYVNTWPREGFGMAMAEATAMGIPVVAPNAGASPEIVDHGATGLLFSPNHPDALATELLKLLTDRGRAAAIGTTARERALCRYGVATTAQETLALYRRLRSGTER